MATDFYLRLKAYFGWGALPDDMLLTVIRQLQPIAYGKTIRQELKKRGLNVSYRKLHVQLQKLEEKGVIRGYWSGHIYTGQNERRRRYYELFDPGSF